ncbi:MAG: succinyl transferase OpgC [Rhodobacteraceae bacterium]|nr:succinyl transferase OpgC [Paracoccaceae bacterium]MBR9820780.1 succinyl transferase OpgC [Paracoccaceae bacterium]
MKRLDFLDGMRGFFLLTMALSHLVLQGGVWLTELHFRQLMFVESAQGFVFLSGLMVGLVQGRRLLRDGRTAMRKSILSRMAELWLWTVGLIFLALVVRDLAPGGYLAWRNWLGTAPIGDPMRIFGILTLTFQPTFMDILPMYIFFMGASIVVIRWVGEGRWWLAAGLSALSWIVCQLEVARIWSGPLNEALKASDTQGLRMAFDPMGWQVLFIAGVILGALWARGRISWDTVFGPKTRGVAFCAFVVMLLFAPLRFATAHGMMPQEMLELFWPFDQRSNFSVIYLANFLAAAVLFSWLVIAGRQDRLASVRMISGGLRWVFTQPALCLLGRHSLHVYAWHVVLVYAVRYYDSAWGPSGGVTNTFLGLYVIALMWVPPLIRERAWHRRIAA